MSESSNKPRNPQDELRWFLNKLISLCRNPKETILMSNYDELTCFPVNILGKEEPEMFQLGRYGSGVRFDSADEEYGLYCEEMLSTIKSNIYKLENYGLHFDAENFLWTEDEPINFRRKAAYY